MSKGTDSESESPSSLECWDYSIELECLRGPQGAVAVRSACNCRCSARYPPGYLGSRPRSHRVCSNLR
ncbi:hypothetical protein J6590_037595 [Homalodisca vitripennis]|nr:hypothetical protein J6590_037595 [Homalodisca vitripennis]